MYFNSDREEWDAVTPLCILTSTVYCMHFLMIIHLKVHLTPNFFFASKNLHALVIISLKKFFDLVKSSIFYAPLKSSSEWTTTA